MDKPKLEQGQEPKIDLGAIQATLLYDMDRFSSGSMLMRIADTNVEVRRDGKQIGSMGVAMGGTFYIQVGNRLWEIDRERLFNAFVEAEKAQYPG